MNNTTIELRQKDADIVYDNGDWVTNLNYKKDLILNNNDSIILRNTFIDTEALTSNQNLVLKKDLKLDIKLLKYYILSRIDNLTDLQNNPLIANNIDGSPYILCTATGTNANLVEITKLETANKDLGEINDTITINYTDHLGKQTTWSKQVSGQVVTFTTTSIIYDKTQPITIKDSQQDTLTTILTQQDIPQGGVFTPKTSDISIIIKQGNYTPQQLIIEMNREFQTNTGNITDYINSGLLEVTDTNDYFVKYDGSVVYKCSAPLLVGTNQFDFDWVAETNQFSINQSHMNYIDQGQNVVGYKRIASTPPKNIRINKNSGVIINSLSSSYVDGSFIDFWGSMAGFDLKGDLIPHYDLVTLGSSKVPKFETALTDGVNITGGYFGISVSVDKTSTDWFEPAVLTSDFWSATTDNTSILASQASITNTVNSYGYYLVSLQCGIKNNFFTKKNNIDVMSIVSKYYEINSYTSGSSDSSLVYTHRGDSITLSSFRCRILRPDKQLADGLGDDNNIYITIQRA